ncbi:hypothetical protein [Nostoc sp. FACHB-280]|nr:hypothetical protein [Nostoc sp. FACHB-280]
MVFSSTGMVISSDRFLLQFPPSSDSAAQSRLKIAHYALTTLHPS